MTPFSSFLSQLDGLNPLNHATPVGKHTGLVFMNVMLILGTGLVLALILLLWARYHVRNRKRRHLRHERKAAPAPSVPLNQGPADEEPGAEGHHHHHHHHYHRRRRHRRNHRPRNPTLGETGGLPPPKNEPTPHAQS